jgi:hypothetical protein
MSQIWERGIPSPKNTKLPHKTRAGCKQLEKRLLGLFWSVGMAIAIGAGTLRK